MIPLLQPSRPTTRATTWTPKSETGLLYWYSSRLLSLSNNDPVVSFTDQSGNGRHLTQEGGASGRRPLFKTNRQNGLPTVLFDGSDDNLSVAFSCSQPVHLICVANQPTFVSNGRLIDGASGNTQGLVCFSGDSTLTLYAGGFGPNATATGFNIIRALWNGAGSKIALGSGADSTANAGTNASGGIRLAGFADGTACANVEFGDVFAYDHELSAGAVTNAVNYLKALWNL